LLKIFGDDMAIKVGINGFGRIGRNVLRANLQKKTIESVAVNDPATLAHLLKYDSVHGAFPGEVKAGDGVIVVNGKEIAVIAERDPAKIPWGKFGAEMVFESTGLFTKREQAAKHLTSADRADGVKKVIISAPSPDADATLVIGVNCDTYDGSKHQVVSNGSCTTNCLAPVAKVVLENFGIVQGMMTTIHSYTNDQSILDLPHKDLRRARAAALSMIPSTTGAAKALSLVIPELKGKLDGMAVRVPTPNVSLVDFVVQTEKAVTIKDVNQAIVSASNGKLKGVLSFTEEPLVSCDFNGSEFSSIVDLQSTMLVGDKMVKILSWYDNEMGFSNRMCDLAKKIAG
jgi:glyceraldehyde 3-phosphate dehydrogenase